MNLGSLNVQIGVNAEPLKQGLSGAKAAVLTWAQEVRISEQHLAALTQQMAKETAATQQETAAKRQAAALERELRQARSQLTAVMAEESAAAQAVAAKYDLLTASQRASLVAVKEQITAQRALQEAQLQAGLTAEKAAAAESAAAASAAAAVEAGAAKQLAAAQKNLGKNLQTLGRGLTTTVTTPLLGIGAAAIAGQVELQGAETQVAAASGAQGQRLQQLDAIVKQVAVSVPNSFKDIGRAVGDLYVRTGQTGDALEKLAVTELNLGRITGEGTNVIRATTQAFAAWNVTADQQIPTLDLLEKAHQLTGVRVSELAANLARSAPILKLWGLSLTDSTALLAGFEKAGIQPQRLITGLAAGLSRLAKAGITDAHQALGIIIKDLTDTEHPMTAIAEATRLFGSRVGTQLVGAIQSGRLNLEGLKKQLEDSGGAIAQTASQTETFFTALNKFGHQAAVAVAPLGKLLLDMATQFLQAAKPIIDLISRMVDWFSKLPPGVKEAIVNFALLAAALGPLLTLLGKAAVFIAEMKDAWAGLSLAFAGSEVVGGLGAIGTAVAGLSVGWIAAFAAITAVTVGFLTNFHGMRDDFVSGIRVIGGTLENLFTGHGTQSLADAQMSEGRRRYEMALGNVPVSENRGSLNRARAGVTPAYNVGGLGESAADIRSKLAGIGAPKAKETPLEKEQTRYTEELTQAHAKLAALLVGEDNIAGQVAARYHLLTSAQRDNLTGVLEQIKKQAELQHSQTEYTKDMGKLNAEIRRLKQGHDAEASGVDALREKYPGLSTAMLAAMNNAIQWKKHLTELHAEAHKVAEEIRGLQLRILEAGTDDRVAEAAARLFGARLLERGKKPRSAADLFNNFLSPEQQGQARQEAGKQAFSAVDEAIAAQRRQLAQIYGPLETGGVGLKDRASRVYSGLTGASPGSMLDPKSLDILKEKSKELVRAKDATDQATAAIAVYDAEWAKFNTVIGTSGVNLEVLQKQFSVLTGKSATAREVMEKFGVDLKDLPKATQANVRAFLELQHRMDFFKEFAAGTQQVFENMFQHLYQHGFKGFFANVIQGFEGMLQQMAARYLASKLADLVTGLIGNFFGGGGGGEISSGAIFGLASGGPVMAGRPIKVGERGPELFVPPSNGSIVPNAQLAGAGGAPINITMHVHGVTDANSFRQNKGAIQGDLYRSAQKAFRRDG